MKYPLAIICLLFLASCSDNSSKSATASAEENDKPKVMPGIAAVDIHGNFTKMGFSLDENITADNCTWTSKSTDGEKDYTVKVFGKGPTAIDRMDAMVIFPEVDQDVKQFIGYSASIPYEGSNPKAATQWALDHFNTGGDTLIGSVKFYLIKGNENSRVLKLNAH